MKLIFSKNNHMKMGYDNEWFNLRSSPVAQWKFSYGQVFRKPRDFKTECILAAVEIRNTFEGPLFVGFSGGVDSEVVAESFRLAKIDFIALILRFPNQKNEHDITFAKQYCEKWNIPIQFYDIDPLAYYQSDEFIFRSRMAHCLYPMLAVQALGLQRASELGGVGIMGGGDFLFSGGVDKEVILTHKEVSASVFRIQMMAGFSGVYRFFRWSPELIAAFFLDSNIQKLIHSNSNNRGFDAFEKLKFYQTHFNLESRPKFYGWEEFSEQEKMMRLKLIGAYPYADSKINMSYSKFAELLGF